MNNPNPFVPKGSLLEQQSQRRSRLKIVVGCVVAISSLSLIAMLIQGCHRENPETPSAPPDTNSASMDTNIPAIDTNIPPPMVSAPSNAVPVPPPVAPPVVVPPVEPTATAGAEYTIVSGDTLAKIAKKNGVTVKALEAANPGVDPKRLKPGKKLTIPGATASAAPGAVSPTSMGAPDTTGGQSYVVKSGDTLTKIAKKNGVTLKALRAANNLTTDHIKVGQKLTIPVKAETAAPAPTTDTTAPPVVPPPATAPTPAPVAPAPAPATGH